MASKNAGRRISAKVAAAAIVAMLQHAVRGRIPTTDRETLSWFDTCAGRPKVAADETIVAAFANANWSALQTLLRHRSDLVRQATLWAMATTRRADVAGPMLTLLLDQRAHFDHDFAYGAACSVGEPLIAPLERIAIAGRGKRRLFAIECIGHTRAGLPAVAALGRIVRRIGFQDGVLNALGNVAHAAVVPIAAQALVDADARVRTDAMDAVHSGLECAQRPIRLTYRRELIRVVLAALADPRTWREATDPWASLLGWGVEVLDRLRARQLLPFVQRCLEDGAHANHRAELARLERSLLRRARRASKVRGTPWT